ncbi:MAG: phosphate ABC transporter substrate-binding protein, partial [Lactobacillaceae bacterium]|nr:phosphate ABC transporter substrate-binding protein [Lactobacillaceae bacterium]
VKPTAKNVENNDWKIWSYEHMYTKGKPYGTTAAYLKFFMSNDFQKNVLPKLGYIPISGMQYVKDANGNVTEK